MVDNTNKVINRIFDRWMFGEFGEWGKIKGLSDFDSIIEFKFSVLTKWESFQLKDYDLGQSPEIEFSGALSKGFG